jgi:hypothetical protein
MAAVGAGDFLEWVALARFGLIVAPVGDSDLMLRLVIHNFNPSTVTSQYKLQQEFLIFRIEIFSATLLKCGARIGFPLC